MGITHKESINEAWETNEYIQKYTENSFKGAEGKNQHLEDNCERSHRGKTPGTCYDLFVLLFFNSTNQHHIPEPFQDKNFLNINCRSTEENVTEV